jgi:glycosyltransferase involved in cell wall biosynthesis
MTSFRLAAIIFDWYPYELRALRLAEAAVDAGFEVDVICLRRPQDASEDLHHGVHVHRLSMSRIMGESLPVMLLRWCSFLLLAAIKVTCMHVKRPYDIVVVHNMPDFLVFAAFFPKVLGAKVILDVQDVSPELMSAKAKGPLRGVVRHLAAWQERLSTAFAHHLVTTGWLFEEVLMQRGVPMEKLTSIHNSADPRVFPAARRRPLPSPSVGKGEPFILMYHGTLARRNGLDVAIRALALARRVVPALRLDINAIGGEEEPRLKRLVQELGLSDYVNFAGPRPIETLADFVANGDLGIIPYQCNGFAELVLPTKCYEYAWMHRPMIASNTRAIRSLFQPKSIVLCEPSRPESFAEAIIDLYQHAEKRVRLVASAAEDYEAYRWETVAQSYQQLLQSLCEKQRSQKMKVPDTRSGGPIKHRKNRSGVEYAARHIDRHCD